MSAIRDDEGSAEPRSSERNLADIKLLRKVLMKFIWSDLGPAQNVIKHDKDSKTVEVALVKMSDSSRNC